MSACNAGDLGSIPVSRRSPGEGNGNPLQYSCLENSMDRGARWDAVHGVARVIHNLATKQQQIFNFSKIVLGSLVGLVVKNLHANAGDTGSIPESRRSPGEGNGSPLQYSCLENSMDKRS